MDYEKRKIVLESIKYVNFIVPQLTKDYTPNLHKYKPAYMVHGTDWQKGPLSSVRQQAIDTMKEWGGIVIEPDYTQGISSSELKKKLENN